MSLTLTTAVVVAAVSFSFGLVWLEPVFVFLVSVALLEMFSYMIIGMWESFGSGYRR